MPNYKVNGNLSHNGKSYQSGDFVIMDEEHAEILLSDDTISEIENDKVETTATEEVKEEKENNDIDNDIDLSKMKKGDLIEYAKRCDVDIDKEATKKEIIAILEKINDNKDEEEEKL